MGTVDDWFMAIGDDDDPNNVAFLSMFADNNGVSVFEHGVLSSGRHIGVFGGSDAGAGVVGNSVDGFAVYGLCDNNVGVTGISGDPDVIGGIAAGVSGRADVLPGVAGWSNQNDGVFGATASGVGVRGMSFHGTAVYGLSTDLSGVMGISRTVGPTGANIPKVAGVIGTSDAQPGVVGVSRAGAGVFGFSANDVGVFGQTANRASFAGRFLGNVRVVGTLTANVKNGVVSFPDGTERVLHCMESPEHWFEDFGTARLRRGRAVVKLDGDFAKVIRSAGYHVFLTPKGDCEGLYVRRQGGRSFEVHELRGGTSGVAFSYRIVAQRKDIKAHRRFARIDDARMPVPAAPARKPTAAALRAFTAQVERQARGKAPRRAKESHRPFVLPARPRPEVPPAAKE